MIFGKEWLEKQPEQTNGNQSQKRIAPNFGNSRPVKGEVGGYSKKREIEGNSLKRVFRIGNPVIKPVAGYGGMVELQKENPPSGDEGDKQENKIDDVKNYRQIARTNLFFEDKILVVMVNLGEFVFKIFDVHIKPFGNNP